MAELFQPKAWEQKGRAESRKTHTHTLMAPTCDVEVSRDFPLQLLLQESEGHMQAVSRSDCRFGYSHRLLEGQQQVPRSDCLLLQLIV